MTEPLLTLAVCALVLFLCGGAVLYGILALATWFENRKGRRDVAKALNQEINRLYQLSESRRRTNAPGLTPAEGMRMEQIQAELNSTLSDRVG